MTKLQSELFDIHCEMAPTRVEVELTEACNLRCQFCYNSLAPKVSHCAPQVLERLAEQGVMELILTGGEPTLHPDFKSIVARAVELIPTVLLQTNGTLLTEELIGELSQLGLAGLNVSLHGTPDIHDALTTVRGSHALAIRSIRLAARHAELGLWVNTVLTRFNLGCLEEHFEACIEAGVKVLTLTRYTPSGFGAQHSELMLDRDGLVQALRTTKTVTARHPNVHFVMANAVPRCALPDDLIDMGHGCSFGSCRFYVDVEGNLMVCGMLREKLGPVTEISLREIKAGSAAFKLISSGQAMPEHCQQCSDHSSCHGGCRAAAFLTSGRLNGPDPYCTKACLSKEVICHVN